MHVGVFHWGSPLSWISQTVGFCFGRESNVRAEIQHHPWLQIPSPMDGYLMLFSLFFLLWKRNHNHQQIMTWREVHADAKVPGRVVNSWSVHKSWCIPITQRPITRPYRPVLHGFTALFVKRWFFSADSSHSLVRKTTAAWCTKERGKWYGMIFHCIPT